MAIFFKEWIAGLGAGSLDDAADEQYARDASTDTSVRVPRSVLDGLFARLAGGNTFTGSQVVPDATADGEALAYDQAAWQLGAGALTGRVDHTAGSAQARTVMVDSDATANNGTFRILVNGDQYLLSPMNDARSAAVNSIVIDGYADGGGVDLSGAGSVKVPAVSGASQAAQVTAYDAALGIADVVGAEIGDTGWRNVSADLETGWAAGAFQICRRGGLVWLRVRNLDYSGGGSSSVYQVPVGFRPAFQPWDMFIGTVTSASGSASPGMEKVVINSGMLDAAEGTNYTGVLCWVPESTTPASLPGSGV